jgi:CBS domain-containing protein
MRVDEVMTRDVIIVPSDATLTEAAELMAKYDIGFLPVVAADVLVGVVTDRDIIVRGIGRGMNPYLTPVRTVMSGKPIWGLEHDVLTDAADILAENAVRRLIVIDSANRVRGLVSIDDLATHMSSDRLLALLVRRISTA